MALDTNQIRLGLLRYNSDYVKQFHHEVFAAIQSEKLRALNDIKRIDEARINIIGDGPFIVSDFLKEIKHLQQRVARYFGFGNKAVGPYEELPFEMQANLSVLRYTDKKRDHVKRNRSELLGTPNINIFNPDPTSISLKPGKLFPARDDLRNKYFPDGGEYSRTSGALAVAEIANKIFPFNIVNLGGPETDNKEIFPAFITSMSEDIGVSWSEVSIINRSENLYFYTKAKRDISFSFILFATAPGSLTGPKLQVDGYKLVSGPFDSNLVMEAITKEEMWKKINFLKNCAFPAYDENERYAKAPILKLNIGNYFNNQLFIMDKLNFGFENLIWDLGDITIDPMIVKIDIGGTIIDEVSPGTRAGKLYAFHGYEKEII